MRISFMEPFSRGWGRMKKALFQPFDIGKWFTVGFTAFLAELTEWHHGGGGNSGHKGHTDWEDFFRFPRVAWGWLTDNPFWFTMIVFGLFLLIMIIVLLIWLSSRGKFMFLDNVVHDRAKVVQPWHDFKKQGNSLFVWRFGFSLACFVLFVTFLVFFFITLYHLYDGYAPRSTMILTIVGMGLMLLVMIIITATISLFLNDFVVPIMAIHGTNAVQAWGRFLPLLSRYFLYFILYGILIFFLYILIVISVIIIGLLTCCIGFILLILPYIGSVIMLPISYTLRAFSLEFLGQFGPEFSIFPQVKKAAVSHKA
ncbi:MAG: hypothetical protein ABIL68_17400 [bacterium]